MEGDGKRGRVAHGGKSVAPLTVFELGFTETDQATSSQEMGVCCNGENLGSV